MLRGLSAGNLPGLELALQQGVDAIVSLCRVGTDDGPDDVEHVEVWLADRDGPDDNPNPSFVLEDTAAVIGGLLDEGRSVYVHCVGGRSRSPTVVARYLTGTTAQTAVEAFDGLGDLLPTRAHNRAFVDALGRESRSVHRRRHP